MNAKYFIGHVFYDGNLGNPENFQAEDKLRRIFVKYVYMPILYVVITIMLFFDVFENRKRKSLDKQKLSPTGNFAADTLHVFDFQNEALKMTAFTYILTKFLPPNSHLV